MAVTNRIFAYDNMFRNGEMCFDVGEVRQVSELSLIRGGVNKSHIQVCDEISYAISGKAMFWSGDECTEITGGQIHFIRKGVRHQIVADKDTNFHFVCIGFYPNEEYAPIKAFLEEVRDMDYCVVEDDGKIRTLADLLLGEIYLRDEQSDSMINAYLTQILITLQRIMQGRADGKRISKDSSDYAAYHALAYINREYPNIKSVKSVAQTLNYSEFYLSHLFREKVGMTVKEYITQRKLKNATALLKNSEMSITEIAEVLNFATAHSFRQAFKRHMGISPSEYRERESKE